MEAVDSDVGAPGQVTETLVETKSPQMSTSEKPKENVTIHSEKNRLSESQIKKEYIYLKLYQQMGINVPDCKLSTDENGKTILEINQVPLVNLNYNERHSDSKIQEQVKMINLVTKVMGDEKKFIGSNINADNDVFILEAVYDFKYLSEGNAKIIDTACKGDRILADVLTDTLEKLTPEIVLDTVIESGLSDKESQELIGKILENKNRVIKNISKKEVAEKSVYSQQDLERIDQILVTSKSNEKFKEISITIKNSLGKIFLIEKLNNNSVNVVDREISNTKLSDLDEQVSLMDRYQATDLNIEKLISFQDDLINRKKGIIGKLNGPKINKILSKIYSIKKEYSDRISDSVNFDVGIVNAKIEDILKNKLEGYNELNKYISLSSEQLKEMAQFLDVVKSTKFSKSEFYGQDLEKLSNNINKVEALRKEFINFCEKRGRSFVSHLSTHEGAKQALLSGSLDSSLRQQEKTSKAQTNSISGERELLPQLAFAVNGVDLDYGGLEKEPGYGAINLDRSVGFIGSYPEVVDGKTVFEVSNGGHPDYESELQIFDLQHSTTKDVGADVSLDKFIFLVPENDKKEWTDFLQNSQNKMGKNITQEWIDKHFKTYPSNILMNDYIKYFVKPEDLGFNEQKGVFVYKGDKVRLPRVPDTWTESVYQWVNI